MEKRINKRIEVYVSSMKDDIRNKIIQLGFSEREKANELVEYLYDYERLVLTKDDFVKRKRLKNAIPLLNRCNARRANGEQCTRRRRQDCCFCGTHSKSTPHGSIGDSETVTPQIQNQKMNVFAEEIHGIVYFLDKFGNVYSTEDIMKNDTNPRIIAKYSQTNEGKYSIPELGLV
jgi:hypothetical protein